MDRIALGKKIRKITARIGILRPLRNFVFWFRGYNHAESEIHFYERIIRPDYLVFDVGANRGQSSEVFTKLGAKVVAFEPQQDLHREIRQICGRKAKLIIEPYGLGAQVEERKFFITAYDQVASLREDWEGVRIGESKIQISTLDTQIEHHGVPDYCKIDVEGWELEVIKGLTHSIPLISFEYHLTDKELECARDVLSVISMLGDYSCNLREAKGIDFALSDFIPINQFMHKFPNQLELKLKDGYGDIFCRRNA